MKKFIENISLLLLAGVTKFAFFAYRILTTIMAVAILTCCLLLFISFQHWQYLVASITIIIFTLTLNCASSPDNPYRRYNGANGWVNSHIDQFIAWLGTLKYFTSPLFLAEDPGSYKIKGHEVRHLIDEKLQPGDILLRGFNGYLDGKLISLSGGSKGLGSYFSHAALYLGEINKEEDKKIAARRLKILNNQNKWEDATEQQMEEVRNNPNYFQAGKQTVIHAMGKGIFVEDILTFVRCDYLIVLRIPDLIQLSEKDQSNQTLVELSEDSQNIFNKLKAGLQVSKEDVFKVTHDSALGKIGSCYDFQFNDIKTAYRFSCSEFVYYCYKSIHCYLGLIPKKHAFMKYFFSRQSITPADIYEAAINKNKLRIIWQSASLDKAERKQGSSRLN